MTQWDTELQRAILADRCKESFWHFVRFGFGLENNPALRRWITPRIHKPLCDWLELHARDWLSKRASGVKKQKHLLVVVPRNFGKTTLVTQAFPVWLSLQDTDLSIGIGSENLSRSVSFFKPLRSVLDGSDPYSRFTWLYGNWYDKDREWTTDRCVHAARKSLSRKDASFLTWGVESGLTGAHPDVLVLDDPTSYEKMSAVTNWLQYVNDHVDSLTPVLNPDGMMVFVGTRYHDGDHLGRAMREEGVATITGMMPPGTSERPDGKWHVYFMAARDAEGKPTFPEVWDEDRLKAYEKSKNLYYWAQVMNDPASSEFVPLTRQQIERLWVEEKDVPRNLRYSIHCDTAFKTLNRQSRGDESVVQVWGHSRDGSGEVYYIEGYSSRIWRMEDFLQQVAMLSQRYKKSGKHIFAITDERETGGHEGAYQLALMSAHNAIGITMPPFYQFTRGITKKQARITEAASYWADGYVRLKRGAPGVERLIDQMSRIGASDHDDWADAASDVFHKDIYIPARNATHGDRQPPAPVRPGDDLLKTGYLAAAARVELYDRYYGRGAEDGGYEPIG